MKKITIQKEILCPLKKCPISVGFDKEGNDIYWDMSVRCEGCANAYTRASTLGNNGKVIDLDEDSKEYKEYVMLHTPICVSGDLDDELEQLQMDDIERRTYVKRNILQSL